LEESHQPWGLVGHFDERPGPMRNARRVLAVAATAAAVSVLGAYGASAATGPRLVPASVAASAHTVKPQAGCSSWCG
jgi:hypothetical protein